MLHAALPGIDCSAIGPDALARLEQAVGLSGNLSLADVFEVLGKERIEFRDLYRHVCLLHKAPALGALEVSAAFAPHLRKVTHAIFKDDSAAWPPRSAKASVPRVIDVPALNLAIGCQHLGAGDVRIPRAAIDGFVKTTRFAPRPIGELFARYRALLAGSEASFDLTRDGVRRSVPIGPRQFRELAGTLFGEGPARENVLGTLYELLDLDYDGTVDAGELLVALNALCSGGLEAKLDVCFDVFDRDGSGFLDREELWDLLHTTLLRGLNLVEALFLQYLPEDHAPGGEQLVLFSLADFSAIEQAAVRALSEADADADGSVDRAEFRAWAAAHPLLGQLFRLSESLFGIA
jgi:Ca2+-binding EF-hand superfamily protein